MKKNIFYIMTWLLAGFLAAACSNDPVFPDPGFDATSDVKDTVRRDTMDVYHLLMQVNAPNGVKTIQILNGMNYRELEQLDRYNGQTRFELDYPINLEKVTDRDTTINLIVKVVDNDLRSFNKAFSITVKPFSAPNVILSGVKGTLGLVSPVFELKALFETGLNKIHSYRLEFGGKVLDEGELGDSLSVYRYEQVLHLDMQEDRDYVLDIILTDDQGTSRTTGLNLRLIDMEPVSKVMINRSSWSGTVLQRELEFFYNPDNKAELDSITGLSYGYFMDGTIKTQPVRYVFGYNAKSQVTRFEEWGIDYYTKEFSIQKCWEFEYDGNYRLLAARNALEESDEDITCTSWHEDGRVRTYGFRKDLPVTDEFGWHRTANGGIVAQETWTAYNKRSLATRMSAVVIPTFLAGFPPVIPERYGGFIEMEYLLMWRYGIENVHTYDASAGFDMDGYDPEKTMNRFSYITNINGRLDRMKTYRKDWYGRFSLDKEIIFVY